MFKLGEYYEDEAKQIVVYLKDAGMKVEQKACLHAEPDAMTYLEGRLSELRGEIEDIETYERYLEALKAVLAEGATIADLRDRFYCEIEPAWAEKKRQAVEILNTPTQSLSDEESEAAKRRLMEVFNEANMLNVAEMDRAFDFVVTALSRNEIEPGQDVGDRLDDPILRIAVNPREYKGHKLLRQTFSVEFVKQYELYIDEFTAPLYNEIDEEFQESNSEEFFMIKALGILIESLVEEPFQGKIDMEDFAEMCNLRLDSDGDLLEIDGSFVAEDIARVLEKNGLIKVKGDKIKWKG
jgi:hypothetical protein